MDVFESSPLDWIGGVISILCGLIIGFERQWNGKPAGIRTSIFICLSAYVFVSIGKYYNIDGDATRVVGQIITGVSFLGGGVIIAREGLVQGVTSASLVWLMAAIGCLCGLQNYWEAIGVTFTTIVVLLLVRFCEKSIDNLNRGAHRKSRKSRQ